MSFELKVPNLNFLVIRRYTLEKFVSVSGSFMDGCSCEKDGCCGVGGDGMSRRRIVLISPSFVAPSTVKVYLAPY